MPKLKTLLPIVIIITLLGAAAYYQYALNKIPAKVAQSQATILNIDSLRFAFKVSLFTQKAHSTYLQALKNQDKQRLLDAIDYFDAAYAFANIAATTNQQFSQQASPIIRSLSTLIAHDRLSPSAQTLAFIDKQVNQVSALAENNESNTWHTIQKNYIEFKTNEYKVVELYQVLSVVFVLFLLLSSIFLIKQQKLIRLNRKQQSTLQTLAFYDPLTQVANRKQLENSLQNKVDLCQTTQQSFYIVLIDLDNFKDVNDLLGHDAGDHMLKKATEQFKSVLTPKDILGRLGGDEFLIIFNEHTSKTQLLNILGQIQNLFTRTTIIANTEFQITTSMGIASFPADSANSVNNSVQHLIKSADIAMYQAKNNGKNQYHFYNHNLETTIKANHQLNNELETAIEQNQFVLYYQPQVNPSTQTIYGAEALVRWQHPKKGLIMPGAFIEFIERGHHTTQFGEWVIKAALAQQQRWQAKGIYIPISINLSVRHLNSSRCYSRILELVAGSQVNLKFLVFEITEYELLHNSDNAIKVLKLMHAKGFRFALDDFGTGYSSLSYLSELPIETIKIDKSFIDFVQSSNQKRELVEGIIHIGHTLNKTMLAEGVETAYQVDFLQQAQCEVIQGFYYSKALPADQFERFLNTHNYKI